jgi:hypothetical protein
MDIAALTSFLAPLLPALLRPGQQALEALSEQVGAGAAEKVRALWARLGPKVAERPGAEAAAAGVVAGEEEWIPTLMLHLKKLLEADPALQAEVAPLFEAAAAATGKTVIAQGDRSVAVSDGVSNSTIITGDGTVTGG